ncbi:hypothetical protein HOM50_05280 [bacterium]|jgi:hypothetical protein|nr:hypothetical protein [bacterium]MBT5015794.1 hypothetical protein [bacterium]
MNKTNLLIFAFVLGLSTVELVSIGKAPAEILHHLALYATTSNNVGKNPNLTVFPGYVRVEPPAKKPVPLSEPYFCDCP